MLVKHSMLTLGLNNLLDRFGKVFAKALVRTKKDLTRDINEIPQK